MSRHSNYDKFPIVEIRPTAKDCQVGWRRILERLRGVISSRRSVLCVECYPGVREEEVEQALAKGLNCGSVISTRSLLKSARDLDAMLAPYLGDDPVFGRI